MAMDAVRSRFSRRDPVALTLAVATAATLVFPLVGAVAWMAASARLWRESRVLAILAGIVAAVLMVVTISGFALQTHGGTGGDTGSWPMPSPPPHQ